MSKQIQVTDRAYAALAARKRPGESFSQAIIRLVGRSQDPWSFVGRKASKLSVGERLAVAADMRGPDL